MELGEFGQLAIAAAIAGALTQIVKMWVKDTRWYPVFSLVLAVAYFMALAQNNGTGYLLAILNGLVAGLTASGLYSASNSVRNPGG